MINFTGDHWPSLGNIGIALAVVAVIVGLVVWRGRRRGSNTIALDAALTIAGVWVLGAAVGAVIFTVKVFAVDWAELSGATSVWLSWPLDLPCSEFGDSSGTMLTCSGDMLSDFTVSNASLDLRLLAGSAQLCSLAFTTIPAAMLAVICFQTLRGRPFTSTVTRTLTIGAIAVLVFGVGSDLLSGIAATSGLREVFPPESEWYPWAFQLTVTPLPLIGALGLAALAAVFRQGIRLQQENEALQRETEGLV
ncbi:hypothetical protein [Microbacterium sp. A93]|uniref:hypothetical protein n=1 Tax=Microbacterium sp. A93 TaxID=3450716 RepID=UPI003F443275